MQLADRIGRRIKLRDLHTLLTVAQQGSMSKAAQMLSVSQPVVSKTITELERELGVPLFDRNAKGVQPTTYGRALLKGGAAVFDELRQSIKQIEVLDDPTVSESQIGTVEFLAGGLVFAVLDQLTRKYPRARFDVKVADGSDALLQDLRERKIDVALGRISMNIDDEFEVRHLLDERLYVIAGVKSRWSRLRKVNLSDLVDEQWSLPSPNSLAGRLIADVFRANGLEVPRAQITSFSMQIHSSLLATGRFLAIVPGSFLRYSAFRNSIKVLPVKVSGKPGPVAIATVRNRTISPMSKLFVEAALQTATLVIAK